MSEDDKKILIVFGILIAGLVLFRVAYNNGYENGLNVGMSTGFYRCLKGISEDKEMIPTAKDAEEFLKDNPNIIKGIDF